MKRHSDPQEVSGAFERLVSTTHHSPLGRRTISEHDIVQKRLGIRFAAERKRPLEGIDEDYDVEDDVCKP